MLFENNIVLYQSFKFFDALSVYVSAIIEKFRKTEEKRVLGYKVS